MPLAWVCAEDEEDVDEAFDEDDNEEDSEHDEISEHTWFIFEAIAVGFVLHVEAVTCCCWQDLAANLDGIMPCCKSSPFIEGNELLSLFVSKSRSKLSNYFIKKMI